MQVFRKVRLMLVGGRVSALRLTGGAIGFALYSMTGAQTILAEAPSLDLRLKSQPISLVDRELLSFTGGKSIVGVPANSADIGLQNPRYRVDEYGDLTLTFVFGELEET